MRVLKEVILHDNESANVDFKATQYQKAQHSELLKDVLALANAHVDGERLIVIGVKLRPGHPRELRGIMEEVVDAGNYQQLIAENVEPELEVDYVTEQIDGKKFGILRIPDQSLGRPFLMKKDYRDLTKGTGFIRRGTTTDRLTRDDYDRIYEIRCEDKSLDDEIALSFSRDQHDHTHLLVPQADLSDLPSGTAEQKIRRILDERTGESKQFPFVGMSAMSVLGYSVPYENRSTEELKRDLSKVRETYFEDDLYHVFEKRGQKVQVFLVNSSKEHYLENATVKLIIPSTDGLLIAPEFPRKPGRSVATDIFEIQNYPTVETDRAHATVTVEVGDVRHGLPEPIFGEKLRIAATAAAAGAEIRITAEIFGRNILNPPLRRELWIHVPGGDSGD